jgi:hypothetical protein
MDRAIPCDSDTRLITTPCSRCTRLPVNSHWCALYLTSVIETREHDVCLPGIVINPRNVKCPIVRGCDYWFSGINARC